MSSDTALEEEVLGFLERFAHARLSGASDVAGTCHVPCLVIEPDGAVRVLADEAAASAWFAGRVDRWVGAGVVQARVHDARTRSLGDVVAESTVDWRLADATGALVGSPRITYQLLRLPVGMRIVCLTVHGG